jgi:hypothetical protein
MTHSAWKACAVVVCLAAVAAPLEAQAAAPVPASADTTVLEFQGFRAGVPLTEVAARLQAVDGTRLRCERAKADRRITECRGTLSDPTLGGPVQLWLSAVDSVTSVLTLSANVSPTQLDAWRSGLEARYGRVGAKVQGPQWMMQWVHRGRMLRLTWRVDQGTKVASVALVDGPVLDAWGRDRARRLAS